MNDQQEHSHYQNVVVMRHGDRVDHFDPLWASTAARPFDPPLIEAGKVRAFRRGLHLLTHLGFPIHRVFVSPFLRCVQTASQAVSALCALDDDPNPNHLTADGSVRIDPSKLKVSIEYGLCEVLNREVISRAPTDGNWDFNISKLVAMFPAGTVDNSEEKVYKELPQWEETVMGARARYEQVIHVLADRYPSENLLFVTHWDGVDSAVSAFLKDVTVYEVEYCAYAHLRRLISHKDQSFVAGKFEVLTGYNQTGVSFLPAKAVTSDE